jgi:hypothetical protein
MIRCKLTSLLQEPRVVKLQVPLEKLRSQEISKNKEKEQRILEQWRLLYRTLAFSLSILYFQVRTINTDIGYTNISIQISNLPCMHALCWMFASCTKKMGKTLEKCSDNV